MGLGALGLGSGLYGWSERRGLRREDLTDVEGGGIERVLRYASLAPSGHNAQPWTVKMSDGELLIGTDRSRWLPKVDPQNRELALSIGCFLENLLVCAPNFGLNADYEVPGGEILVRVGLKQTPVKSVALDRIATRRTLRTGHKTADLAQEDLSRLFAGFGDGAHYFSATSKEGRYLAEGTIEANRIQADRDDAEAELAHWIRWTNEDGQLHRDGLTPESMELSGVAGWYVRHFMDREAVMGKQFRAQGVDRVREQVGSCGGWIVVTSPDGDLSSLIETGRRTERMWLGARERSIAIHPMTQMLEESAFQRDVAATLGLSGPIQFLLRVGYVDRYPEPVSLRLPVSAILR